jgi:putative methylase
MGADPSTRRGLARRLEAVAGFEQPRPALEQYRTPPEVAAGLVHEAGLRGDLDGRVVDLGAGTGMLALAAALRGARAVGVERDPAALATARGNERRVAPPVAVDWVLADAARLPVCTRGATVLANPPFGAQTGHEHADRAFLRAAARIARTSYSIHNAGSRSFVASFAADHGGRIDAAYAVELDVDHQFEWHDRERAVVDAEAYRIEWE